MGEKIIPVVVAVIAAATASIWLLHEPPLDVEPRLPTTLVATAPIEPTSAPAWSGQLETFDGKPGERNASWPQFRGPKRDNVNTESVALAARWPKEGPPVVWERKLGQGHAGAAVHNGCVYVIDYDKPNQRDVLRCMSLADGSDIWAYSYPVKVKFNHGMSRTVPSVTDDVVVSFGPKCHVLACDAKTGEHLWHIDLVREYGSKVPTWYAGQCPSIAVDLKTGEVLWRTPNPGKWEMTHSSIAAVDVGGLKVYVYCGSAGVGVVSADGKLLWRTSSWQIGYANVPTPVPVGGGRVLLTGEYNAGAMMLQLTRAGDAVSGRELFRRKPKVFGAHQHTPIFCDGYVYSARQGRQLACMTPEGDVLWESGPGNRYGIGPYLIADGKIVIMDSKGNLSLVEATPEGFRPLTKAKVLPGPDSWGAMALVDGRLILRDLNVMKCLDLRAK